MIQHVYALWSGHHNKLSYHLSPYKVNAVLFTVLPVAIHYISGTYLFYNWKFVLLNPLHPFCPTPFSLITINLFSVTMIFVRFHVFTYWVFFCNLFGLCSLALAFYLNNFQSFWFYFSLTITTVLQTFFFFSFN